MKALLRSQSQMGPDLMVAEIEASCLARSIEPGQFVHVRVGERALRRPFSAFGAQDGRIEILYRIRGKGTAHMAAWRSGEEVDLLGPLGRGYDRPKDAERILLVGGGVGVAPLVFFGERYPRHCRGFFGFRTVEETRLAQRLDRRGIQVETTVEEGASGTRELVTDRLMAWLARPVAEQGDPDRRADRILTCGPWPMMAAVAAIAQEHGIECQVALERQMACGIGVCLGCVVRSPEPERPYLRVCTDGPVFAAKAVAW